MVLEVRSQYRVPSNTSSLILKVEDEESMLLLLSLDLSEICPSFSSDFFLKQVRQPADSRSWLNHSAHDLVNRRELFFRSEHYKTLSHLLQTGQLESPSLLEGLRTIRASVPKNLRREFLDTMKTHFAEKGLLRRKVQFLGKSSSYVKVRLVFSSAE